MKITLDDIGKRFHREWIFKNLSFLFETNNRTGIIGPNGSGKSTLIQILSAAEPASQGKVTYFDDQENILAAEVIYNNLSFAAPYIDLPSNLTAEELVNFYSKHKPLSDGLTSNDLLNSLNLSLAKHKRIKNFSSGMKQRLKLGLAITSKSPILLLDEPCSNLDNEGIEIYHLLMDQYALKRLVVIGSNENPQELYQVDTTLSIHHFK